MHVYINNILFESMFLPFCPFIGTERRETGQYYSYHGAEKTRQLEEDVQRLSQTLLDLQASVASMRTEIGRAHVCTPVTFRNLVGRLLLDKNNKLRVISR